MNSKQEKSKEIHAKLQHNQTAENRRKWKKSQKELDRNYSNLPDKWKLRESV